MGQNVKIRSIPAGKRMEKHMISDSLSFGMREALDAGVADQVTFITACKFKDREELETIIEGYLKVYWVKHPKAAEATRKAWKEGRIITPKTNGCCAPIGFSGHRLHKTFEEWRDAVSENAPEWDMGCYHPLFKGRISKEKVLSTKNINELVSLFNPSLYA